MTCSRLIFTTRTAFLFVSMIFLLVSQNSCKFFQKESQLTQLKSASLPSSCLGLKPSDLMEKLTPSDWAESYISAISSVSSPKVDLIKFKGKIGAFQLQSACKILEEFLSLDQVELVEKANQRIAVLSKLMSVFQRLPVTPAVEGNISDFSVLNFEAARAAVFKNREEMALTIGENVMEPALAAVHAKNWIEAQFHPLQWNQAQNTDAKRKSAIYKIAVMFGRFSEDLKELHLQFDKNSLPGLLQLNSAIAELKRYIENSGVGQKTYLSAIENFIDVISLVEPRSYFSHDKKFFPDLFDHHRKKNFSEFESTVGLLYLFPTWETFSMRSGIAMGAVPVYPLGVATKVFGKDGKGLVDEAIMTPAAFAFHDLNHAHSSRTADLLTIFVDSKGREVSKDVVAQNVSERAQFLEFLLRKVDSQSAEKSPILEAVFFCALHEEQLPEEVRNLMGQSILDSKAFREAGLYLSSSSFFPGHPAFIRRFDLPEKGSCERNVLIPMKISLSDAKWAVEQLKTFSKDYCKENPKLSTCDDRLFFRN